MSNQRQLDSALLYLMNTLTDQVQGVLGDNFLSLYLNGSIALGSYDAHSDLDFLAILDLDLSTTEIEKIQAIHNQLYDTAHPYSNHLEGSYIAKNVIQNRDQWYQPVWYIDNGSKIFERSDHDNQANVYWVTRKHGICIYGDDASEYIPFITHADLIDNVQRTMIHWNHLIETKAFLPDNMWAQPFTVMTWCRMMQTLATGTVQSKEAGVNWGVKHLGTEWTTLIQDSWNNRTNPLVTFEQQPSDELYTRTLKFLIYAFQWSQTYFSEDASQEE